MPSLPENLWRPAECFFDSFVAKAEEGRALLSQSKIAFVGLARNCDGPLSGNLDRLAALAGQCGDWALHIESNDCTDNTVQVLIDFTKKHRKATFHHQFLGRQQMSTEFSGPRTIAMAEYRTACQRWIRDCAADSDFVVVIDFDQWGGWSDNGLMNGIGWLHSMPEAS